MAVAETAASLNGLANVTAANTGFVSNATTYVASIAITDVTGAITVTTIIGAAFLSAAAKVRSRENEGYRYDAPEDGGYGGRP